MTRRFCLTLNLKTTSPSSLNTVVTTNKSGRTLPRARDSGIEEMQIYLLGTRMFIIMDVNESVSLEALMWNIQQAMPDSQPGESGCPWNASSN
jgi:L-rhamnose mutarotase